MFRPVLPLPKLIHVSQLVGRQDRGGLLQRSEFACFIAKRPDPSLHDHAIAQRAMGTLRWSLLHRKLPGLPLCTIAQGQKTAEVVVVGGGGLSTYLRGLVCNPELPPSHTYILKHRFNI